MKKYIYFAAAFIFILLTDSCTIHKRHYAKGFYIQLHPFHRATNILKGEKNSQNKLEKLEPTGILTEKDTTRINSGPSTKLFSSKPPRMVKKAESRIRSRLDTIPQTEQERIYLARIQRAEQKSTLNRNISLFTLLPLIIFGMMVLVYDSPIFGILLVSAFFLFTIAAIKWSIYSITRRVSLRKLYRLNPNLLSPKQQKTGSATFLRRLLHFLLRSAIGFVSLFLLSGIFNYLASVQKEKYKLKVYAILLGISTPLALVFLYFGFDIDILLSLSGIFFLIAGISLALLIVFSIINARIDRENEHNNRLEEIKNESKTTPVADPTKPTDPTQDTPSAENLDLKLVWLKADEAVQKKNRQIIKLCIVLPFIYMIAVSTDAAFFIALLPLDLLLLVILLIIRFNKVDERKKALRNLENTTSPSGN